MFPSFIFFWDFPLHSMSSIGEYIERKKLLRWLQGQNGWHHLIIYPISYLILRTVNTHLYRLWNINSFLLHNLLMVVYCVWNFARRPITKHGSSNDVLYWKWTPVFNNHPWINIVHLTHKNYETADIFQSGYQLWESKLLLRLSPRTKT